MAERDSLRPSLDDAIDGAVRQMMDADARPGFERRVMHRLAARPAVRFPVLRFATAAAVLATIVAAVFLLRAPAERTTPATNTGRVATADRPGAPPQTANVPTAPAEEPSTVALKGRERRAPRRTRERTADARARVEVPAEDTATIATVAALDAPAALAVETIEHRPVTISEIGLARLEIRGLQVAPLPGSQPDGKE